MNSKLLILLAVIAIAVGGYGLLTPAAPISSNVQILPESVTSIQRQIWVARSSLPKGHIIKRSDLELQKISETQAIELGVDQDLDITFTAGMVLNTATKSGDIVWPEHITRSNQEGYIDLIIAPDRVPFPIIVRSESIVGGVIHAGSLVDVLALSSLKQNLANDETVRSFETVSLTPVLLGVRVLQTTTQDVTSESKRDDAKSVQSSLVLELTRKQVAKLTIARHIAQVEIHASFGDSVASDLSANAGDVLTDYKAVQEYRADKTTVR